jgi:hypothetical protein
VRVVINTAIGGSTLAAVRDRLAAEPNARGKTLVIWDGSANSYGSVAATCASIDQIIAWHGNPAKIVFVPSVNVGPSPDGVPARYGSDPQLHRDRGRSDLRGHAADQRDRYWDRSRSLDISAGVVCASLLQDAVHLTQPAMDTVADQVASIISANGL